MKKLHLLLAFFLLSSIIIAQTTIIDSILSGGIYRNYRVYVPATYTGISPRPLILDLHGYTSSAAAEQVYSNFMPIADTATILMVYPNGTLLSGQPYWNAGFGLAVNDIQFISNLIDTLSIQYNIDPNSIYSCGMSNGGYMSHTLACALNNKITAIASVTGTMTSFQHSTCNPNRAVPVMQVSGTNDPTVTYTGSSGSLPIDTLVHYWALNNNCSATAVFNNVPNINVTDGCTAEHYVYNGGTAGSSVELYKIIGGAHTWPGSPYIIGVTNEDFNASEKIWLFFRKYKLNQFVGVNEISDDAKIHIFPNPCADFVNMEGREISSISIQDVNGKLLIETTEKQIDISSLAKGFYFVVVISGNNHIVKKLVKI